MANIIGSAKKAFVKSIMSKDPRFTVRRSKQEDILNSMDEPADNFERSYAQYRCQKSLNKIQHTIFAFIAPVALAYRILFTSRTINCEQPSNECGLLCVLSGIEKNRVPLALISKYNSVMYTTNNDQYLLSKEDLRWFRHNIQKKHPFAFLFQLKALDRIMQYRHLIEKYHPTAIANHIEYSCSSSLLTELCHKQGIKHIDFMHGEKVYYIRDSFFRFDECYVWNQHYVDMFKTLRSSCDDYIISIPPLFKVHNTNKDRCWDYTYYLAGENENQMKHIADTLGALLHAGFSIKVRPHPRWTNKQYLDIYFSSFSIETDNVDINASITETKNVISLFSTVLFQGYLAGAFIIIDDISNIEKFDMLRELDYIGMKLPHHLLSEVIDNCK